MMSLAQAQAALQESGLVARLLGAPQARFTSVSTDSRTLEAGALYVALRGPRFDGHDFAAAAAGRGAAALLVEHAMPFDLPQLIVAEPRAALGRLAARWRAGLNLSLIGVAGSNGKTTTTQMIAAILAQTYGAGNWFATLGNRNNDIGVPQMLLALRPAHRAAVLELGMNHRGEIAQLAGWAAPTVALVTNAQREHQEFLDSAEATAHENGQVIAALPPDGVAVFPADDACAPIWRALAGARPVHDFALHGPAAVQARYELDARSSRIELHLPRGSVGLTLELGGVHNVRNALAAAAACAALGIAPPVIAAGLAAFRPVGGRGTRQLLPGGATLIDESYNANPDSVRAAIDLLAQQPAPRVLVFGDMGEVGHRAAEFHREIGAYARARGIETLLALGEQAQEAVAAFGPGARHYASAEALGVAAQALAARGDRPTLLVKGSRFMRLERVVRALEPPPAAPAGGSGDAAGAHA